MLEAVESYKSAVAAADEAYETARTVWSAADTARRDAVEAAWTALRESDDALVAYIADQASTYRDEALKILEILPASAQEIRETARANGFDTTIFNGLLNAAVADGVLSAQSDVADAPASVPAAPGAARRRFLDRVRASLGSHAVDEAEQLLNAVVAEESGR